MKKIIIMFLLSVSIFAAEIKKTKSDYIFTRTKEQLEKVMLFVRDNDVEALDKYMQLLQASNQGGYLKENAEVYVEDYDWGLIKFRAKGTTMSWWTVSEAVKK
ncbi:MAG: hypothetical protein ACRCYA_03010 [Cetobacterium sp.]|uniref:hypothetical protein n=1 Tax=Cetobacterium sp. TaxID=2071632 RepID=UPI003F3A80D8